jgi:hypothetical protein
MQLFATGQGWLQLPAQPWTNQDAMANQAGDSGVCQKLADGTRGQHFNSASPETCLLLLFLLSFFLLLECSLDLLLPQLGLQ